MAWKYGFSTAIKLEGQYSKVVNYISKYISKDSEKIFGNYYFAGGKGLKREVETEYFNLNFENFEGKYYKIPNTNLGVKYLDIYTNK